MIEDYKKQISYESKVICDNFDSFSNVTFQEEKQFFLDGNRLKYERKYFERRRQLSVLGLAFIDNKAIEIKEMLENVIWEICNEFSWALPAHYEADNNKFLVDNFKLIDLFAAETGQALSEIVEIHEGFLDSEIRNRVIYEIERRIIEPLFNNKFAWESMLNNWSGVIASCIGMTSLSLYGKGHKSNTILNRLNRVFETYLSSFGSDGASEEGIGYWAYGYGYYIYFAEKYLEVFDDPTFLNKQKVKKIAEFPSKIFVNNKLYIPYSDISDISNIEIPSGLLSFCKKEFSIPGPTVTEVNSLEFDSCYRWAQLYRNLIWSNIDVPDELLGSEINYLDQVQWLVHKDIGQKYVFSAKGGNNNESHNHNDIGHFILGDGFEWILTDLGAGEYTKNYFKDSQRYDYINNSSKGHSVPIINLEYQRFGNYFAKNVKLNKSTLNEVQFSLNLADLYAETSKIKDFTREFESNSLEKCLTIEDNMTFSKERNVVIQNFVSSIKPSVFNKIITWKGTCSKVICPIGNFDEVEVEEIEYKNHFGKLERIFLTKVIDRKVKMRYKKKYCFKIMENEGRIF